ncbi:hypothetical protein [Cohnella cholangitidis]|uniref:Uncharacterized protein n=1 Tax=Cohnella cholangitidis TaxID=2598458 RepID=A0A7G5C2Q3_9BACL|nr:hypothetical protein [Cohnella cholangitidis]QMV43487.1 hypothetical protein FPL14_21635 [Cohnella cholangitidis]
MFPFRFRSEKKRLTTDLATVESQRNERIPEEFPEGPYGSTVMMDSLEHGTSWRDDQRSLSAFAYENRELHTGLDRDYPGDHDIHSENDEPSLS